MAVHANHAPAIFARAIAKGRPALRRLRSGLRAIFNRRRQCAKRAAQFERIRMLVSLRRSSLVHEVQRYRRIRVRLLRSVRRQRQLQAHRGQPACRFRLARLTPRIQKVRAKMKQVRRSMVNAQNRLIRARKTLVTLLRQVKSRMCRRMKLYGNTLAASYRRRIFRIRRLMRRVHRRWLLAESRRRDALRLTTEASIAVKVRFRTLSRTARKLIRRRRILCESGRRKFCNRSIIHFKAPSILKKSLASQCGIAMSKKLTTKVKVTVKKTKKQT